MIFGGNACWLLNADIKRFGLGKAPIAYDMIYVRSSQVHFHFLYGNRDELLILSVIYNWYSLTLQAFVYDIHVDKQHQYQAR